MDQKSVELILVKMNLRNRFLKSFLFLWLFCSSCAERDLRGWWTPSDDQKSYLVVEDFDGGQCPPVWLDGEKLAFKVGEKIEVKPGAHRVICGDDSDSQQGVEINIKAGTIYYFDYWGP